MIYLNIKVKIFQEKKVEFEDAITAMLTHLSFSKCHVSHDIVETSFYTCQHEFKNKIELEGFLSTNEYHAFIGAMKVLGEIIESKLIYPNKEEKFFIN